MENDKQRFDSKYDVDASGCWVWRGPLDKDGYGAFFYQRFNRRAHRYSYYAAHGAIPAGLVIHHTCRNRACVNPAHLQAVTTRENSLVDSESIPAINARKVVCKNGHGFDKVYVGKNGKSYRVCSICERSKQKRLQKKWREESKALRGIC